MKLTDSLISRCGYDKLLHFLVAAWIVSLAGHFGWGLSLAALLIITTLAIVKEIRLDPIPDWKDLWYTVGGGIVSFLIMII